MPVDDHSKRRILVVDDESDNSDAVKRRVEANGFSTNTFSCYHSKDFENLTLFNLRDISVGC